MGQVATRQRTTTGVIIAHEPANHNRYGYRFDAQGRDYLGWETPPAAEPRIGQEVTVYYDNRDPTDNALTDFADLRDRARAEVFVLMLLIVAVSGGLVALEFSLSRRQRYRLKRQP